MEYFHVMEHGKRLHRANEVFPDSLLLKSGLLLLMSDYFMVEIPISGVVHNDTESLALINKRLLVRNNVIVLYRGQNSNFVEGVFSFFLGEVFEGNFFECILTRV
jgi:hypothetical protein